MPAVQVKYDPRYVPMVKKMAELGATVEEIAEAFSVVPATIYRWRLQHDEFREALTLGREASDERVERALYKRAVGYKTDVTKVFHYKGDITTHDIKEEVHPDVSAALAWLYNRRPEDWNRSPTPTQQQAPPLEINIGTKPAKGEVRVTRGGEDLGDQ